MEKNTEFLICLRKIIKSYESYLKEVGSKHGLSNMEADVIGFLHNNPGKDTASDIVELRMMQKGNVSQAVETLIKKDMLIRTQDTFDRRKQHLALTAKTEKIVEDIYIARSYFLEEIFKDFSPQEFNQFSQYYKRIIENISNAKERE